MLNCWIWLNKWPPFVALNGKISFVLFSEQFVLLSVSFIFFILRFYVVVSSLIIICHLTKKMKRKNYFGSMGLIIHIAISIVSNKQVNWWTFIEYEFNIHFTNVAGYIKCFVVHCCTQNTKIRIVGPKNRSFR